MTLITFDLDNTLWDVDPVIVRANHAMEAWFEERFPGFHDMFDASAYEKIKSEVIDNAPNVAHDVSEIRKRIYVKAFREYGLPTEEARQISQSAFDHFYAWRQKVDLYPEAKSSIAVLAEHYRMGVITNGNADVYHPSVGLGAYFEFALRADEVGRAKPNPEIFEAAAVQADVDTKDIIHIGDHPIDDVQGAAQAGCRTIWFNRHGARHWKTDWDMKPDSEVHSLRELPTAIAELGVF
ncbi:HAD family hydrolase [Marinomonas mediterranea]|jgi:haloacid dehalogenase superfamily, subfamily IA, variant 1 with third motif having Dx(3-4)D or Dx(3-4)E|uniref:HAD-superfamily hydrolase, subfamily IA, variant 1 n=1 Tax=Marinomonas mediterranea (strain ATCC 700492 / JCM 21426 / NBRC 103028 / MMB-1) TaxID=717774 RepID=F2K0S6_MARM1|nr:HAD-IA family hydrolase [Marinomonas mediterranea]ADZ92168.1 HAD-superfamily hydrolase, subfamily IA, variant 1 [Marinomonas mediterranea MMB-1]WCN18230.1 HAD-IA family hydrolase [Marinomonas mediterranea MMB-1]